jgi:N-acetylmuramoyl-L-alanine amidase
MLALCLAFANAQLSAQVSCADEPPAQAGQPDTSVSLRVNGAPIATDVPPVIVSARTLVPARAVFEALGGSVAWDDSEPPGQVLVSHGGVSVKLTIGSTTALVNGVAAEMDVPAQIVGDRTLIPVRFVSESLGFAVSWDEAVREVNISTGALSAAGAFAPPPESAVTIDAIDITATEGGTRVTITGAGVLTVYSSLSEWDRFTLDLTGAALNVSTSAMEWQREISVVGGFSATQTAIIPPATPPAVSAAAVSGPAASGPALTGAGADGQAATPPALSSAAVSGPAVSGGQAADPGAGPPPVANVTRFVFDMLENITPVISFSGDMTAIYLDFPRPAIMFDPRIDGKLSVMLDPGHGAETAGKRSPDSSLFEYEFNRDMASRIKYHLERHGVEALTTVSDNTDLPLADRCKAANESDADIFVSIHANAYGNGWTNTNGWEIYVYRKGSYSEQLAKAIHSATIPASGLTDRGIKAERFYVIRNTNMPSVLIEHGFYTNRAEVELLKSPDFRERLAVMDAKGMLNFLGVTWIEPF